MRPSAGEKEVREARLYEGWCQVLYRTLLYFNISNPVLCLGARRGRAVGELEAGELEWWKEEERARDVKWHLPCHLAISKAILQWNKSVQYLAFSKNINININPWPSCPTLGVLMADDDAHKKTKTEFRRRVQVMNRVRCSCRL
jgi:hypothetical protein